MCQQNDCIFMNPSMKILQKNLSDHILFIKKQFFLSQKIKTHLLKDEQSIDNFKIYFYSSFVELHLFAKFKFKI